MSSTENQQLAAATQENEFVTVSETTLPNGILVPSFNVGKYITGRNSTQLAITASVSGK